MVNQNEIERLLRAPEQDLLLQWHDEEMKRAVGASADDLVGVLGDLRNAFVNWCQQVDMRETICTQWNHAKRQKYSTQLQLACALADLLASIQDFPAPFAVAVLLVQQLGDEICRDG